MSGVGSRCAAVHRGRDEAGAQARGTTNRHAQAQEVVRALQRTLGNRRLGDVLQPSTAGRPLDADTLASVEARFGRSFEQVRVHDDEPARAAADQLDARAFTFGNDIFFAAGEFVPGTGAGDRLLHHELAHVVQQGRGGAQPPALDPAAPEEHAAERVAQSLDSGATAVEGATGVGIARQAGGASGLRAEELRTLQRWIDEQTSSASSGERTGGRSAVTGPPDELRGFNEALLGTPGEVRAHTGKFARDPGAVTAAMRGFAQRAPNAFGTRIEETATGVLNAARTYHELGAVAVRSAAAAATETPAKPGTVAASNPGIRYLQENARARRGTDFLKFVLEDFQADRRPLSVRFGEGLDALSEGVSGSIKRSLGEIRRDLYGAETPEQFGGVLGRTYGNVSADATVSVVTDAAIQGLAAERSAAGATRLVDEPAEAAAGLTPPPSARHTPPTGQGGTQRVPVLVGTGGASARTAGDLATAEPGAVALVDMQVAPPRATPAAPLPESAEGVFQGSWLTPSQDVAAVAPVETPVAPSQATRAAPLPESAEGVFQGSWLTPSQDVARVKATLTTDPQAVAAGEQAAGFPEVSPSHLGHAAPTARDPRELSLPGAVPPVPGGFVFPSAREGTTTDEHGPHPVQQDPIEPGLEPGVREAPSANPTDVTIGDEPTTEDFFELAPAWTNIGGKRVRSWHPGALVGTSQRQFRRAALRIIGSNPKHPLGGLLHGGKFLPSSGDDPNNPGVQIDEKTWLGDPRHVEAGHVTSNKEIERLSKGGKSALAEQLIFMSTYKNRLLSALIEHKKFGEAYVDAPHEAIDIGGLALDPDLVRDLLNAKVLTDPSVLTNPKLRIKF